MCYEHSLTVKVSYCQIKHMKGILQHVTIAITIAIYRVQKNTQKYTAL